ncbi:MAG: site-2 protease family protein [Desulfovibrionaceae bacterium]
MFDASVVHKIALMAVPMLLAVTCHEVAHGYMANLLGDPTARLAGRLNLNPIKHLDPMGTLVFVLTAIASPFVIGWAKPVPINPRYFRRPLRGMMYVSAAGPGANFILAILSTLALKLLLTAMDADAALLDHPVLKPLALMCFFALQVNLVLGFFNLIPVPPLDGSKILTGLLPAKLALRFLSVERYGMILVVILLATGMLGRIIMTPLETSLNFLINFFAVPVPPLLHLLDALA